MKTLAPALLGFVEGPVPEPAAPPMPAEPDAATLPASVETAAATIQDDEIRRRFLETAARYIGRTQARRGR